MTETGRREAELAQRLPDSNYELQKWKMLQLRKESLEEEGLGIGFEGNPIVRNNYGGPTPEEIAKQIMNGDEDEDLKRQLSKGIDAQELDHEFSDHSREVNFYFFVNKGSGGRMAPLLLDMEIEELRLPNYIDKNQFPNLASIKVKIVPLNDPEVRTKRFKEVKALSEKARHDTIDVYVIACGGDGTVIWVIQELVLAKVNINNIASITKADLPNHLQDSPYHGLKKVVADFLHCEIRKIDIWEIEIVCREETGCIKKVEVDEKGNRVKVPLRKLSNATGEEMVTRKFARKMSNYCSIGIDARIGLGFDKNRSQSRWINKLVYAWEGIKKFLKPSKGIQTVIDRMESLIEFDLPDEGPDDSQMLRPQDHRSMNDVKMGYENNFASARSDVNPKLNILHSPPLAGLELTPRNPMQGDSQDANTLVPHSTLAPSRTQLLRKGSTMKSPVPPELVEDPTVDRRMINGFKVYTKEIFRTNKSGKILTINPINLIALNIPSYMGGITNMWDKSGQDVPIGIPGEKLRIGGLQDMGDGKLEFLSFTDNIRFGVLERLLTGGGKRVAQGGGPFLISFKQSEDPINNPLVTYAQVDGEYMQLVNPLFFRVGLSHDLPKGKVNVLFKPKPAPDKESPKKSKCCFK